MIDPLGGWPFPWPLVAGVALAYLLGSIPFGLILTRLAGEGDIRAIGSGNIGATNVLRTGRKGLAALTLLLDAGKGLAAVLLGWRYGGPDLAVLASYGAMLGHCFPIWLKFRGGKGVATFFGVVTGLAWPIGLIAAACWLASALLLRISSVAGLAAAASAPIAAYFFADRQIVEATAVIALLIWARHWQNILRLLKGEEPRIGGRKASGKRDENT